MKIFLDDVRMLPKALREEGGWIIARTGEECLAYVRSAGGLTKVEAISFDNDLGSGRMEGYQVLNAIERMVVTDDLIFVPEIMLHSANPAAVERMRVIVQKIIEAARHNHRRKLAANMRQRIRDHGTEFKVSDIPLAVTSGDMCGFCGAMPQYGETHSDDCPNKE